MPLTIMTSTTQTNAELATYKDNKNDKQLNWLFLDLKGCKLIGDIVKDYKQGWGGAKDPVPYPRDGWIVLGKLNLIFWLEMFIKGFLLVTKLTTFNNMQRSK